MPEYGNINLSTGGDLFYMKKLFAILLVIVLALPLLAATSPFSSSDQQITILFTHDLHSHIDTTTSSNGMQTGGFAKIKTIINQYPDALVVDAGDFSMGTLYQSVYTQSAIELRLLGQLGYDATTFGNHEFDYTAKGVAQMLTAAKNSGDPLPALVNCNINWDTSPGEYTADLKQAFETYGGTNYTIVEKNGISIAIFGLMGKDSDECAPTSGLVFEDIITSAKQTVAEIKANTDAQMIVCLSHSGTNSELSKSEDEQLAIQVPEIDVIISGHTHTLLEDPILHGNTVIGSCGNYGEKLGKMVLTKKEDGRWQLDSYEMLPIDNSITADTKTLQTIDSYQQLLQQYLFSFGYTAPDEVLAYSPFDFTPQNQLDTVLTEQPLGNLIADSYIYAVQQAEGKNYQPIAVAIAPVGVIRASFSKGNITVSDVYNVSSLGVGADGISGYPLVSVYLTGAELKTVAEIDVSVSKLMPAAQLYCSGLVYTYNPNRLILNRVTSVQLQNSDGTLSEIEDDQLYRVVSGMYSAQMLSAVESKSFGLLSVVPKDQYGNPITNFNDHIITGNNGEVKEWYALASYLQSFPQQNGLPTIPEQYGHTLGRKNMEDSKNIIDLLKSPNKIFFLLLGVIVVVVLFFILLAFGILKIGKRLLHKMETEDQKPKQPLQQ